MSATLYPERERPGVERPLPMRQRDYQIDVAVNHLTVVEGHLDAQAEARMSNLAALQERSEAESMAVLHQMDSVEKRISPGAQAVESTANDIEAARRLVDLSIVGEMPSGN